MALTLHGVVQGKSFSVGKRILAEAFESVQGRERKLTEYGQQTGHSRQTGAGHEKSRSRPEIKRVLEQVVELRDKEKENMGQKRWQERKHS